MKNNIYAVLTGDLVGSSRLDVEVRRNLVASLHSGFLDLKKSYADEFSFQSFRGDSFQCVITDPRKALNISIIIRASIISLSSSIKWNRDDYKYIWSRTLRQSFDTRISIGIGSVDYLPDAEGITGIGEAFLNSGLTLDAMKSEQRLRIKSRWENVDEELNVAFGLLDVLIKKWSPMQAIAMKEALGDLTQDVIASRLGVTQAAVQQRLKNAGSWAIFKLCTRYQNLIINAIANRNV